MQQPGKILRLALRREIKMYLKSDEYDVWPCEIQHGLQSKMNLHEHMLPFIIPSELGVMW